MYEIRVRTHEIEDPDDWRKRYFALLSNTGHKNERKKWQVEHGLPESTKEWSDRQWRRAIDYLLREQERDGDKRYRDLKMWRGSSGHPVANVPQVVGSHGFDWGEDADERDIRTLAWNALVAYGLSTSTAKNFIDDFCDVALRDVPPEGGRITSWDMHHWIEDRLTEHTRTRAPAQ